MSEKSIFESGTKEIILPEFEHFKEAKKTPTKHTSFLLGAGFSVNQGYPTANELNKKIQSINLAKYTIAGDGSLAYIGSSNEDPNGYSHDALKKYFLDDLIKLFVKVNKSFDYEDFYDFIVKPETLKRADFNNVADEFRKKASQGSSEIPFGFDNINLISKITKLINQIIELLLVDKEGKNYYESIHQMKPLPDEYTGFLEFLEQLGKSSIVHIHTLNHDILFETFDKTDWIIGELSTGFDELGSKFYGRMERVGMVRLKYFSNRYDKRYRLYKLHGSLDQIPFRSRNGEKVEFIKIKKGLNLSNIYKEIINKNDEFEYENDFTNYHADFLSGTTAKILRYDDEGYYKEVFSHFINNMKTSARLIIVGYGCRDSKINDLILEYYDYAKKESVIIDPFPSDEVKAFATKIGAKLIEQTPAESLLEKLSIS